MGKIFRSNKISLHIKRKTMQAEKSWKDLFGPGLGQVEQKIRQTLTSSSKNLRKALKALQQNPGKNLRPLLVILSASIFLDKDKDLKREDQNSAPHVEVAAAVELIHIASLIHDDIIDNATLRRGLPAAHILHGKPLAILLSNFLLGKAFQLLHNQKGKVLELMSRAVTLMCEGESEQLQRSFDYSLTEDEYFKLNYKKTSFFLASCCESGARCLGITDPRYLKALHTYGNYLGYAFQIMDDVLDFSSSDKLGKPVGTDLKQGILTLPVIYMLQRCSTGKTLRIINSMQNDQSGTVFNQLKNMVSESGALKYSLDRSYHACAKAGSALRSLPRSPYRDQLQDILQMLITRVNYLDASIV